MCRIHCITHTDEQESLVFGLIDGGIKAAFLLQAGYTQFMLVFGNRRWFRRKETQRVPTILLPVTLIQVLQKHGIPESLKRLHKARFVTVF